EAIGVHFPPRLGVRVAGLLDATRTQWPRQRIVPRHASRVVVHADEVDRLLEILEVRRRMIGPGLTEDLAQLVRVRAKQERIEILPIHVRLSATRRALILCALRRGVLGLEVHDDSDAVLAARTVGFY